MFSNKPKYLTILGSTGSIGRQTLEVVSAYPDRFQVVALSAGENLELLKEQIIKFAPTYVCVKQQKDIAKLKNDFPKLNILAGENGLVEIASLNAVNLVVISIVGVAALKPTIAALKTKKDIAIASKEVLVAAGKIVMALAQENQVKILPVDSEHSAIMQCLTSPKDTIAKIILTASGGAFHHLSKNELTKKTHHDALKHPNWQMGKKITIDSATLMNKGLEVIEAHWLFGLPYNQIEVVIHPQSIIHSLVEYKDGSVLAQLALPDMRLPIQYALFYPDRQTASWPKLDLLKIKELTFKKPDLETFKALQLAYQAGQTGGTTPAVLNAANEEAVQLFLNEKIKFLDIAEIIEETIGAHKNISNPDLDSIIAADLWARNYVQNKIKEKINV